MRWTEINERTEAKAPPAGFDSKVWFHGSARAFKTFRAGKPGGINELGIGIYFAGSWNYANTWARQGGQVYRCFLRAGDVFNYDAPITPEIAHRLHAGHTKMMMEKYSRPASNVAWDFEDFEAHFLRNGKLSPEHGSKLLPMANYVRAIKPSSQIPDQTVVFDPNDIVIVSRGAGGSWGDHNENR